MFEASGRYDGHFVFAPGKRYQLFPAFSEGWRISEEKFMQGISWMGNLKIRGSYGESGALPYNADVLAPYQYLSAYQLLGNNVVFNDAISQGQAAWPFDNSGSALRATLDYWTPENINARYPIVLSQPSKNSTQVSDWWLRKSKYLRLKSAEIGYSLPPSLMSRIGLQTIRVFASGQNLVIWSKEMKDFDPEASNQNGQFYPRKK